MKNLISGILLAAAITSQAQNPFTFTVAPDASGDFNSIQKAIDACQENQRSVIFIKNGTYKEKILVGSKSAVSSKQLTLIGESKDGVVILSDQKMGDNAAYTWDSICTVRLYCKDFIAQDLTMYNNAGLGSQAITLYTGNDRQTFINCAVRGYQDTYRSENARRCYFKDCLVEGTVDFIYAGGVVFFDDCNINCVKGGGYVTAPGGNGSTGTIKKADNEAGIFYRMGFFFRNCQITANSDVAAGSFTLGRPWQTMAPAYYINCKMGSHINAKGWTDWGGNETSACFCEYNSMDLEGKPLDVSQRVNWSYQIPKNDVDKFFYPKAIFPRIDANNTYDPESICASSAQPASFTYSGNELSWSAVDGASGYIIYKNGNFLEATAATSFTDNSSEKGSYTIRTVNAMGVLSKPKTAVNEIKEELLAFPTAFGFGKYATGGRGGKVVTVTTLSDDAENPEEGSLRWAIAQYPGEPLTVVFNVSGYITLKDILRMQRKNVTIAGQTAPGEGICIRAHKVNIGGSKNVIIRNMRFRCGSKDGDGNDITADQSMGCENVENVIFDHCNFGWSAEECVNNQDTHYMTFQWCILHEGLYDAGHHKGKARSFAAQWGGSQTTFHHNLLANNYSRSPRFNGARNNDYVVYIEYINNVNYNWGKVNAVYGGENSSPNAKWHTHEANMVGNYYKPGPSTNKTHRFYTQSGGGTAWKGPSYWYISDNIMEGNPESSANNWNAVGTDDAEHDLMAEKVDTFIQPKTFYKVGTSVDYTFDWSQFTLYDRIEPAKEAYENVLENVGCAVRDSVERRIIRETRTGTATFTGQFGGAGIIDDPDECEGYIDYPAYTCYVDSDGDGIPDDWETAHNLDPNNADDRNLVNNAGYTALEVYINSLMGEVQDTEFTTPSGIESSKTDIAGQSVSILTNPVNEVLKISSQIELVQGTIYSISGAAVRNLDMSSDVFNVHHLSSGIYFLNVLRADGQRESIKFIKK